MASLTSGMGNMTTANSTLTGTGNYSAMGTQPAFVNQPMMFQQMGVRMGMGVSQPVGMGMNQPMGMGMSQPMGMGMTQPMGMGMTQPVMTGYGNAPMYSGSYQMGAMNWSQVHK